jgi:ankyrin repeat protein
MNANAIGRPSEIATKRNGTRYLLKGGTPIEFDDLHRLIKRGEIGAIRAWIESGGDVRLTNRYGWTLLMMAALHARTDIVEILLAAGADADAQNKFGDTAASLADLKGARRTARRLRRWVFQQLPTPEEKT